MLLNKDKGCAKGKKLKFEHFILVDILIACNVYFKNTDNLKSFRKLITLTKRYLKKYL